MITGRQIRGESEARKRGKRAAEMPQNGRKDKKRGNVGQKGTNGKNGAGSGQNGGKYCT